MNDVYFSFHTQAPEWCINSLLDINLFVQIVQTSFISIFLYYKMDQDTALHLFLQFSIPSACYNACT